MESASKIEDFFDATQITSIPEMNLPRIYNWLKDEAPSFDDPFNIPTIQESILAHGIHSIRKIPRINEHSSRKEPPFYGAQIILNNGEKFRFSYEIDLWINYAELVASFRTEDSTPETSQYHEQLMLAQYQYDVNSRNAQDIEDEMNKRLSELPYEMRANLRNRYQEKIVDATLLQTQLRNALDQARTRYRQSMELDRLEEQEHSNEVNSSR